MDAMNDGKAQGEAGKVEAKAVVKAAEEVCFSEEKLKERGGSLWKTPLSQLAYYDELVKHGKKAVDANWKRFVAAAKERRRQLTLAEAEKVAVDAAAQAEANKALVLKLRDEQLDTTVPEEVAKGLVCAFTHNHATPCSLTPTTWHPVWDVDGEPTRATADDGSEFRVGVFTVDIFDAEGVLAEAPIGICEQCQPKFRAAAKAAGRRLPRFCSHEGALNALQRRREWQERRQAEQEQVEAKRKQMSAFLGMRGQQGYANHNSGPRDVTENKSVTGVQRDFGGSRAAKKQNRK